MPEYKVRGQCGSTSSVFAPMSHPVSTATCPCGCKAKRVYVGFAYKQPWVPHFNASVGAYVRSEAEFKAKLNQGSDKASEATGIEHNYQMIPAGERVGVTETGS